MLVVSDTSPLSNLAIIGRLELLREQFGEVIMPSGVTRELSALDDSEARRLLSAAQQDGWLKEMTLPDWAPFPPELSGLDAGEIESLRLAMAIHADHVLMDEKDGRQRAAAIGVRTIGVLGILIRAKQSGSVTSLRAEVDRLRRDAGFFVDRALEARVFTIVGE
jgi:predicted nucleic acid-binding protein